MDTTVTLVAHTAKCSASTTTIAGLLPDGEAAYAGALGGFGNIAWKAIFDASQLAVGKYRLCADLDGHGPLYSSGDTDELVDVVKSRRSYRNGFAIARVGEEEDVVLRVANRAHSKAFSTWDVIILLSS